MGLDWQLRRCLVMKAAHGVEERGRVCQVLGRGVGLEFNLVPQCG